MSDALGVEVELDMRRAQAADTTMLARAANSLTQAGVEVNDALTRVGL